MRALIALVLLAQSLPAAPGDRRHWAFEPVARPDPPASPGDWGGNPIDAFVLARLRQESLVPSSEADRITLLRRLSLDLIGLPPTPEEADTFAGDASPAACDRLVDRLLASPHFGEHWARRWLDSARYADTNGYEKDKPRTMWRYRDWVINALNADMPFDQFTVEQLAGDMLSGATTAQRIATGFHRNTMINEEGGADQEEFRYEALVDRVNTTATVFLGLTLGCAQCHNHKYDPLSQREYFQLYAFFNNADEPLLEVPTEAETRARIEADAELARLEGDLLKPDLLDVNAGQPAWEASMAPRARKWMPMEVVHARSHEGTELVKIEDGSILAEGPSPGADTYELVLETPLEAITAIRIEALTHPSLPANGPGRGRVLGDGNFVLSEVSVSIPPVELELSQATADFAQKKFEAEKAIDGDLETGWSIEAGKPGRNVDRTLVLELKNDVHTPAGGGRTKLHLKLVHNYTHEHNLGRFRVSATAGPRPVAATGLPPLVEEALATAPALRSEDQVRAIRREYRWSAPELAETRKRIEELQASRPKATTTLVLQERTRPRVTRLKVRGEFRQDGDPVEPGTPACLPPLAGDAPRNRLELSKWIVHPANPLTARVLANRTWQSFFGRGLVATPEDFGTRADPPTHPELLDWLAAEIPGSGWSLKALCRLISSSAVYRQSSTVTPQGLRIDPHNALLARGPRFRLDAECVRDVALSASGLLATKIGGPSVFPPQPEGVNSLSYGDFKWVESKGADRFRRGLYTFWKRTSPYAAFITFDAPAGDEACVRRVRTNTPLQALTLLNDTVFLEAARALARRALAEAPGCTSDRVRRAFRLCVAREPDGDELASLVSFVESKAEHFRAGNGDPARIAYADPASPPEGDDAAEQAAWTLLARVLLNLDETITRP